MFRQEQLCPRRRLEGRLASLGDPSARLPDVESNDAASSACSPPPCGEGLGVGVVRWHETVILDLLTRAASGRRGIARSFRRIASARAMRATPTDAERKLWWHLRYRLPLAKTHFRRQVRFGTYIVDFASHAAHIVIEVDGGQHGQQSDADAARTKFLESEGYRVLRYWNNDVLKNIDGVLEDIQRAITSTPTPNPSPQGGGE